MDRSSSLPSRVRLLISAKLGRCGRCIRLSLAGTLAGWALVVVAVRSSWPALPTVAALGAAGAFSALALAHGVAFMVRRPAPGPCCGDASPLSRRRFLKAAAAAFASLVWVGLRPRPAYATVPVTIRVGKVDSTGAKVGPCPNYKVWVHEPNKEACSPHPECKHRGKEFTTDADGVLKLDLKEADAGQILQWLVCVCDEGCKKHDRERKCVHTTGKCETITVTKVGNKPAQASPNPVDFTLATCEC